MIKQLTLATQPVNIPGIQVAGISPLEQAGITQAGQTGVGAGTVTSGIGSIQTGMHRSKYRTIFKSLSTICYK